MKSTIPINTFIHVFIARTFSQKVRAGSCGKVPVGPGLNGGGALGGAAAVKVGAAGAAEPPGVAAATVFPHDGQNFDSGGSGLPQLGQNIISLLLGGFLFVEVDSFPDRPTESMIIAITGNASGTNPKINPA
jgi:hypothetical protein